MVSIAAAAAGDDVGPGVDGEAARGERREQRVPGVVEELEKELWCRESWCRRPACARCRELWCRRPACAGCSRDGCTTILRQWAEDRGIAPQDLSPVGGVVEADDVEAQVFERFGLLVVAPGLGRVVVRRAVDQDGDALAAVEEVRAAPWPPRAAKRTPVTRS